DGPAVEDFVGKSFGLDPRAVQEPIDISPSKPFFASIHGGNLITAEDAKAAENRSLAPIFRRFLRPLPFFFRIEGNELRLNYLVLLLLSLGLGSDKIDYEKAHLERKLKAVRVMEKISVDGRLEEPIWNTAPLASNFIQTEPVEGDPATEKTDVR